MTELNQNPLKKWRRVVARLLAGGAISWQLCGCAHRELTGAREAEATLPNLTTWLTGPVAGLLTNQSGFEAECEIGVAGVAEATGKLSGLIFARGSKLRLETVPGKAKSRGGSEFGLIWDTAADEGYMLSDALQGYAALRGSVRFTNLLTGSGTGQPDRLEGHPVDHAEVTAMGNDGKKIRLNLTRAQDLGNLPLQISSAEAPSLFSLTLTKVRLIPPAETLFLPPDGFTKYESETALLNELASRQQHVLGGERERVVLPEEGVPGIRRSGPP